MVIEADTRRTAFMLFSQSPCIGLSTASYGLCTECSAKNVVVNAKYEPLHAQNDEINGNIKFLQTYPVIAADALLEITTAVISAVLSLDEHLSRTNTSCVPKLCYQPVYCCLIRYFLVKIDIPKLFMNSGKRFQSEVMFENNHTSCS
jgi:hypothetical protein